MIGARRFLFGGEYELDESCFELRRAGEPVAIQRRVMDLLVFLVVHRDRVATREEIFAAVWPGVVVTGAALGHAVMEARRALGEHGDAWIQTIRGRGFRFMAPVTELTVTPPVRGQRAGHMVGRSAVWHAVVEALTSVEVVVVRSWWSSATRGRARHAYSRRRATRRRSEA